MTWFLSETIEELSNNCTSSRRIDSLLMPWSTSALASEVEVPVLRCGFMNSLSFDLSALPQCCIKNRLNGGVEVLKDLQHALFELVASTEC